jgi:subtilisin family serine protease
MNKLWRWCWLIGLGLALGGGGRLSGAGLPCAGDYASGRVLVGLRDDAGVGIAQRLAGSEGSIQSHSIISRLGVLAVRVPAGHECAALETLRRDPRLAFAELDYAVRATEAITPNDPYWSNQWGLTQIGAPAAWSVVTGTPDVVIAVLDTGVYLDHEDLASKLWTNPGEVPGNGVDDDGNGKIDDVHGWHFYHSWSGSAYLPVEDGDVRDDNGHGTHVSGVAAAATNNGVGIAGVTWGAQIMPVKVLGSDGTGWDSDVAAGIVYAADNGARIINLSLGQSQDSATLRAAVDYARSRGALVMAAAGNTGGPVLYPAAYDPVLAVAATDASDQGVLSYNHGPQVDVSAPGQNILSTGWPGDLYADCSSGYCYKKGTSMATPHVSGLAALLWSRWPALTADAVAMQITRTTVDVNNPGWDEYTGWGRVNAAGAVTTLTIPADLWIYATAPTRARPGQVITYVLQYGNGGGDARDAWITATLSVNLTATTPLTRHEPIFAAASGPYTFTLTAMVGPDVLPGVELTCTAAITAMDMDLNSLDNTTQAVTRVGYLAFLPVALKE